MFEDVDIDKCTEIIIESAALNRGDECIGTDIVYCHSSIYDSFISRISEVAEKFKAKNPMEVDSIGIVNPDNLDFIKGELLKRSKIEFLISEKSENELELLHTSIIPLTDYETAMEYPGPILSVRSFNDLSQLKILIEKDLHDNNMLKNLTTSVFTEKYFDDVLPILRAYLVKKNIGTHEFNFSLPHQGTYILRELSDRIDVDLRD